MTLWKSIGIWNMDWQKNSKKGLPSGAKNLVWEAFLENQDFTQKPQHHLRDLLIIQ